MQTNIKKTNKNRNFFLLLILTTSIFALILFKSSIKEIIEITINDKVVKIMQKKLQTDISIGDIDFSIINGLEITITKIKTDTFNNLQLNAEKIKINISLFQFIAGNNSIKKIIIYEPELFFHFDNNTGNDAQLSMDIPNDIPPIVIKSGTIHLSSPNNLPDHLPNNLIDITDINGELKNNKLVISATVLNSTAIISLSHTKNKITGLVKINNFKLQNLGKQISGITDANVSFNIIKDNQYTYDAIITLNGGKTLFSWCNKTLDRYKLDFNIQGNSKEIDINNIFLKTSLTDFTGSAKITDIDNYKNFKNGKINLSFSSGKFQFNEFIHLLPKKDLDKWLSVLLFKQIRNGEMTLPQISYKGAFKDFSNWFTVYKNFYVKGELRDSSFGSLIDSNINSGVIPPKRITNISATLICKDANVSVKNISGYMGKSKIDKIDLSFPDCKKDEFKMEVKARLDMDIADFLQTWKAALYNEDLCHILDPVSVIGENKNGRIKADITYQNDMIEKDRMNIRGTADIYNSSFSFHNQLFENITCSINAKTLTSQVIINAHGLYEKLPINHLNLVFQDLFAPNLYTFSITTDTIPKTDSFSFSKNTKITLAGKGNNQNIQGQLNFLTDGFQIKKNHYKPVKSKYSGQGFFSGTLWPLFSLNLKDIAINSGLTKPLVLNGKLNTNSVNLHVSGGLDIESVNSPDFLKKHLIKTTCDISVKWGDNTPFLAKINFDDLFCKYGQSLILAKGSLDISQKEITFKPLNLTYDKLQIILAGSLDFNNIPHYSGNISVNGFKLENKNISSTTKLPNTNRNKTPVTTKKNKNFLKTASYEDLDVKFSANTHLFLTNTELYGIKINNISGNLNISDGNIIFSKINATNKQSKASGSIALIKNTKPAFDLTFIIKDQDLVLLNKAITPNKNIINGTADINGRIHGTMDSLNGNVSLIAKTGEILKKSFFLKVFGILNIHKKLNLQSFDYTKGYIPYNKISANCQIKNSVISTDDLHIDNNNIPMTFIGKYNINTNEIDGVVAIQFFELADKILSSIPVVGWILTGNKKKLFLITLDIKGNIDDPSIILTPIDTLSKPVISSLLRVIKLPKEILTNPLNLMPGVKSL